MEATGDYEGLYRDYIGVIGCILGLYRDNGEENGQLLYGILGYIGIMEKKMETTIWYTGVIWVVLKIILTLRPKLQTPASWAFQKQGACFKENVLQFRKSQVVKTHQQTDLYF